MYGGVICTLIFGIKGKRIFFRTKWEFLACGF